MPDKDILSEENDYIEGEKIEIYARKIEKKKNLVKIRQSHNAQMAIAEGRGKTPAIAFLRKRYRDIAADKEKKNWSR